MKCHYYLTKHCLSCDLLTHSYTSSIKEKEQKLSSLFHQYIDKVKASVICEQGAEGTRNKAKLAVAMINGAIEFGFYDHVMQFKKLENCPLHAPAINDVLVILKDQLRIHQIRPYDLFSKKGELKYVLITYSESAHELLIRFVLRSSESIIKLKKLTIDLISISPLVKVITANIQPVHQAILEGDEEIVLTETDSIVHHFNKHTLFQGPRSFFQTHSAMALKLYEQFQNEFKALSINTFLDLYCGVGAFSFFASPYCVKVTGVEISESAIYYANKARGENRNIDFLAMDAEQFLSQQMAGCFDAIMVNPPRRGLNDSIIAHLIRLAPAYLFYSSCNVETLHRDIVQLEQAYQVQSLQIFDMFPFTKHFETLAVLRLV